MVEKIRLWLQGKKTYLVAIGGIVAAIVAWANGALSGMGLIEAIIAALGLTSLRAAISKVLDLVIKPKA